jgi:hypothetical protein
MERSVNLTGRTLLVQHLQALCEVWLRFFLLLSRINARPSAIVRIRKPLASISFPNHSRRLLFAEDDEPPDEDCFPKNPSSVFHSPFKSAFWLTNPLPQCPC